MMIIIIMMMMIIIITPTPPPPQQQQQLLLLLQQKHGSYMRKISLCGLNLTGSGGSPLEGFVRTNQN